MAYLRRRNSADGIRFDVCWRENGRDRSRTFTFRKDAERFRTEVERRAQLGALYEAPPITLAAARESWKERWQIGKAASTVQRKDEAWPHVRELEAVRLNALTPAMLEDTIADAARLAPRQAQLALGTVKQVLRDAMKRGQRVDPALLDVKAPSYEEREPVFLSAAEVEHLASWCSEPRLITFAALSGLRLGEVLALRERHRGLGLAAAAAHHDRGDGRARCGVRLGGLRGSGLRHHVLGCPALAVARGLDLLLADLHDRDDPVVDVDVEPGKRERLDVAHDLLGRLARGGEDMYLGRYGIGAGDDAGGLDARNLAQRFLEFGEQAERGHRLDLPRFLRSRMGRWCGDEGGHDRRRLSCGQSGRSGRHGG